MDFNQYQEEAFTFAKYPTAEIKEASGIINFIPWIYPALALSEEAGEVAGKFSKAVRDNQGDISETKKLEIKKELGDLLWNLSALAYELNFKLEDIAISNIQKLRDRKVRNVISGSGDNR